MQIKGAKGLYADILDVYVYNCADKIRKSANDAINSFAEGKEAEDLLTAAVGLTKVAGVNVKEARRRIADKLIEDNSYKF